MPRYQAERQGTKVQVKGRDLAFSFWPSRFQDRRYSLQSKLFVSSPWNIIEKVINTKCSKPSKAAAIAYFSQAKEFYEASQSRGNTSAKPLLIYYSFMNVMKAVLLTNNSARSFGNVYHGLKTHFPDSITGAPGGKLTAHQNTANNVNLYDLMLTSLYGSGISSNTVDYQLSRILPQILLGHRLWCQSSEYKEKFVSINTPEFMTNDQTAESWLRFDIPKPDLSRLVYSAKETLQLSGLNEDWRLVTPNDNAEGILRFETINSKVCNRPLDVCNELVKQSRNLFWHSITTTPPFRKYYIFLKRPQDPILPQLASIYMIFFYLGSITRYRPHEYEKLTSGPYGDFFNEFVENQPSQWLYMLASELAEQEVTRAAVV